MRLLKGTGTINWKSLSNAVKESNSARAALRRLQNLRRGITPRISGSDAHAITGALYFMDRVEYAKLVNEACHSAKSAKPLRGPRLLIKGIPLHHARLHYALEAHDAVVVAEDDWWGSRAVHANIAPARGAASLVRAIFENYYLRAPSPRVSPIAVADRWFQIEARRGVDGVVFYLPPDDDVYGWDYPRQRDYLYAHGIPSVLIREDASRGLSRDTNTQLQGFMEQIRRSRNASRL